MNLESDNEEDESEAVGNGNGSSDTGRDDKDHLEITSCDLKMGTQVRE